jgi:hypothetical protein
MSCDSAFLASHLMMQMLLVLDHSSTSGDRQSTHLAQICLNFASLVFITLDGPWEHPLPVEWCRSSAAHYLGYISKSATLAASQIN